MHDVSKPEYWAGRYQRGEIGWDKGVPAPAFLELASSGRLQPGARLLVVGAGYGHEALFLAEKGYAVTAIDFAEPAVVALKQVAAERGIKLDVEQGDVFELAKTHPAEFDVVLEQACFCAIDPSRRDDYVENVAAALKPHGLLFGLFFIRQKPGGPPFSATEEELRARFARAFRFEELAPPAASIPGREGEELQAVLWKR